MHFSILICIIKTWIVSVFLQIVFLLVCIIFEGVHFLSNRLNTNL